jgi:predicted AlkP superfamily pyrophosphatase or phosphodiesterase
MLNLRYLLFIIVFLSGCQKNGRESSNKTTQDAHVILISIDGFRHDYAQKYNAKNILEIAQAGVSAEALVPSFPSLTFPNHYTIVTGKYPANHGILANSFYSRGKDKFYKLGDRETVEDGNWYGGEPIWVVAENNGITSASYFWVGSEADIRGKRPSYYYLYSSKVTPKQKVDKLKEWLDLPDEKRPRFITIYFSEVDHEGHEHGPDSDQVKHAVEEIDIAIGEIFELVKKSQHQVNLVITSDHGMIEVDVENPVFVEDYTNFTNFKISRSSTLLMFYSEDTLALVNAYNEIRGNEQGRFSIYKKNEIPDRYNFTNDDRVGDLVLMSEAPYIFGSRNQKRYNVGVHGYDPANTPEMNTIFYAWGPAFKARKKIPEFENIHIYPALLKILGIQNTEPIDGDIKVLKDALK